MATYTYTCENAECDIAKNELAFEATQSMKDDALTTCPDCGEETLKRIILSSAGGHRIGGMPHGNTSMWNVSGDPGPRRKGYDCDPMN